MDSIHIQGGMPLQGKVRIQGSKNAALPILAATLLTGESSFLENCPRIADVYAMLGLLRGLGCQVSWREDGVLIDAKNIRYTEMKSDAVSGMRSSLCLLGALTGRCGEAAMRYPGGCVIGKRPIDLHIRALEEMGVEFGEEEGIMRAKAPALHGAEITLEKPSVGATENVLLAAVMAEGKTVLYGGAKEPEIDALCGFLCQCGADIRKGEDCLEIYGGRTLYGTHYRIPADRIVAGTYLLGGIGIGGSLFLEEAPAGELGEVIRVAEEMGGRICICPEGIFVQAPERPAGVKLLSTAPYPGFPTDLQSVFLAVSLVAEGEVRIEEKIFENRFRIREELQKMGAFVEMTGADSVLVHPVERLRGAEVEARELRGGAALVVAGLMAEGETVVKGCAYIERGYANICRDFRELGARVTGV